MFRQLKNMVIKTYNTLYDSYVASILNYGSAVWGFSDFSCTQVLQNRVKRFYMGVNGFAPNSRISIEFDWLDCKNSRWLEMLRYMNWLAKMKEHRWPHIVHKWDLSLRTDGWADQVSHILQYLSLDIDQQQTSMWQTAECSN